MIFIETFRSLRKSGDNTYPKFLSKIKVENGDKVL